MMFLRSTRSLMYLHSTHGLRQLSIQHSIQQQRHIKFFTHQRRLIFSSLKTKIKDLVGIEKTKEEKRQAKVDETLSKLTKNMPAPFKAAMFLAKPFISKMVSAGAQAMEELQSVQEQAQSVLSRDARLADALGSPISISPPMMTSSASVNSETSVTLHCAVRGSKGQGMAKISSRGGEIVEVLVEVNGREIRVEASSKDDIIEAEFRSK
mmetsp:Transcript_5162/g.9890  ORF Transcript_5162/g.9890 Transcript_5162/m.9890 type:complete len:209 (+) Transcript_5162:31-657(+)